MDLLIHIKHNLLISNNLDQIWFWKKIPITFSQGCTIHIPGKNIAVVLRKHPNDVIMSAMASQITSLTIVYSTLYSGADQRKHQSSAPLAFVRGIHRWPANSQHKGPVMRKMFPFDDVIMGITSTMDNKTPIYSITTLNELTWSPFNYSLLSKVLLINVPLSRSPWHIAALGRHLISNTKLTAVWSPLATTHEFTTSRKLSWGAR